MLPSCKTTVGIAVIACFTITMTVAKTTPHGRLNADSFVALANMAIGWRGKSPRHCTLTLMLTAVSGNPKSIIQPQGIFHD
jgi:hypothetical protein